jgi:hypothetical protein
VVPQWVMGWAWVAQLWLWVLEVRWARLSAVVGVVYRLVQVAAAQQCRLRLGQARAYQLAQAVVAQRCRLRLGQRVQLRRRLLASLQWDQHLPNNPLGCEFGCAYRTECATTNRLCSRRLLSKLRLLLLRQQ